MDNNEKTPEQIVAETAAEVAQVADAIAPEEAKKPGFFGRIKAFFGKKWVKRSLWITGGLAVAATGAAVAMKMLNTETNEG